MGLTCTKIPHRSPAAARKWARKTGGGYTAKHTYLCTKCSTDDTPVYHFTKREQPPVPVAADPRLQPMLDYLFKK